MANAADCDEPAIPPINDYFITIHTNQQYPADGKICTDTIPCGTFNVCCVETACEFELPYEYTYYARDTYDTSWDCQTVSAYTVNYDTLPWACTKCAGVWEPEVTDGTCCGDDTTDDPDWGQDSCEYCPLGQFGTDEQPSLWRHWSSSNTVPSSNRCCGDDSGDCGTAYSLGGKVISLCSDRPGTSTISTSISTTCANPEDEECQQISTSTQNTEFGPWYWKDATQANNKGVIWDSWCSKSGGLSQRSYLSNGEEWVACTYGDSIYPGRVFDFENNYGAITSQEVQNPYNNLEHGYLCFRNNVTYSVAECCGSSLSNCNNNYLNFDFGGKDLLFGGSANLNNLVFFCIDNLSISQDLDNSPISCNNALYTNGSSRNYLWTGTKCCSEPDDVVENYNDINGTGACFNKTTIRNGHFVENLTEIAAVKGSLYGCNLSDIHGNSQLLNMVDTYTGQQLIENVDYCTVKSDLGIYCDYSGKWKYSNENRSNLVYVPSSWSDISEENKAGCCKPTDCWNGSVCYPDQGAYQPPNVKSYPIRTTSLQEGYRCAAGDWVYSKLKPGLYGDEGFCPRNEQCFVSGIGEYKYNNNPDAPSPGPQCINNGQYIGDNYCENGLWSSRTKLLSLSLLSLIVDPLQEDYSLYCGAYTDVLNYYSYTSGFVYVKNLFLDGVINHLCVLDYADKLILATSLNEYLNESSDELGMVLPEFINCNFSKGPGFVSCNQDNKAWFDRDLKSIVYSKKSFQISANPSLNTIYSTFVRPKLQSLNISLHNNKPTDTFSYNFMMDGLKFDYLYLAKEADKKVLATLDTSNLIYDYEEPINIVVRYEGQFSSDLNNIILAYNKSKAPKDGYLTGAQIASSVDGDSYNLIASGGMTQAANIYPYGIWSDLTGKLRLK